MCTTQFLRYVNRIRVSYYPLNPYNGRAKEWINQMLNPRMAKLNPKCDVDYKIVMDGSPCSLNVTFIDGTHMDFNLDKTPMFLVGQQMKYHHSRIEAKRMIQGLDDEDDWEVGTEATVEKKDDKGKKK
eukprot:GILJ01001576.1.p1 GENE.GILJ01001576.1~~GILJ01001576.1.p1  ORF type:complete len:128 (+),score=16.18 GILJ01001576.1:46-429(+)